VTGERRRLPRAEREAQMRAVARQVFAERGFHDATMDEIAARVGVSKQMVYTYVGSKEELFLAVYREATAELEASIDAAASERADPAEQLWAGLLAFFAFVDEQREAWSIFVGPASTTSGAPFAVEVARLRGQVVRLVAQLFAEARLAAGGEDPGDTEPAARALVAAGEAVAAWWLEHPDVPRDEAARRLMDVVWLGLRGLVAGEDWRPST
jgi:AcrR family transcriptional regulator